MADLVTAMSSLRGEVGVILAADAEKAALLDAAAGELAELQAADDARAQELDDAAEVAQV